MLKPKRISVHRKLHRSGGHLCCLVALNVVIVLVFALHYVVASTIGLGFYFHLLNTQIFLPSHTEEDEKKKLHC